MCTCIECKVYVLVTSSEMIGKKRKLHHRVLSPPLLPKITAIRIRWSESELHSPFAKGRLCFPEVLKECSLPFPSAFLTGSK